MTGMTVTVAVAPIAGRLQDIEDIEDIEGVGDR
jgi:hypothetical protein